MESAFGTPSGCGTPAAQLKQFVDPAGGLWAEGVLRDKPVTRFTSADHPHGGLEAARYQGARLSGFAQAVRVLRSHDGLVGA